MDKKEQLHLGDIMVVASGEERVYENKYFSIDGLMTVEGVLCFRSCIIDAKNAKIKVKGELYLEGCKVQQPTSEFITVEQEGNTTINSCEFYCSLPFNDSVIVARDNCGFMINFSKFYGEQTVVSMMSESEGLDIHPFKVPFVEANKGEIYGSQFVNFTGCRVANVLYLVDTTFESCNRIEVGGCGEKTRINRCHFINCKEINVYDGDIECTEFKNIGEMYTCLSKIIGCTFSDFKCSLGYALFLEDSNMENCSFDNVEMSKNAYLIEATDETWLSHCKFTNCKTEREDLELIHCEGKKGRFLKKTVEFDIVDHETCTGLDCIEKL